MALSPQSLARIGTLQPSVQPLARNFAARAEEVGIPVEIVQGVRSPEQQDALFAQGGVTKARAMESYHNYALAFDAVPKAYLGMKDWNPSGPLWQKLGVIGEGVGLKWGGRWTNPDLPHFEWSVISIAELKAYWEKFKTIMPITVQPTMISLLILAGVVILYRWILAQKK